VTLSPDNTWVVSIVKVEAKEMNTRERMHMRVVKLVQLAKHVRLARPELCAMLTSLTVLSIKTEATRLQTQTNSKLTNTTTF